MRHFALPGFRLGQASREIRLVYTGFLGFTLIGLITIGLFQLVQIRVRLSEVTTYYRGGETATAMTFPKTFTQLLEVTHFHAFIMGVVFLILGHLLLATGISRRCKEGLLLGAFAGSVGDLGGTWLIRYVSVGFAVLQLLAWLALWIGYGGMLIAAVWEMWGPPPGCRRRPAPQGRASRACAPRRTALPCGASRWWRLTGCQQRYPESTCRGMPS